MDNIAEKWNTQAYQRADDGNWEVLKPDGSVRMTLYRSDSFVLGKRIPTIFLSESGGTQKVRFGSSIYSY